MKTQNGIYQDCVQIVSSLSNDVKDTTTAYIQDFLHQNSFEKMNDFFFMILSFITRHSYYIPYHRRPIIRLNSPLSSCSIWMLQRCKAANKISGGEKHFRNSHTPSLAGTLNHIWQQMISTMHFVDWLLVTSLALTSMSATLSDSWSNLSSISQNSPINLPFAQLTQFFFSSKQRHQIYSEGSMAAQIFEFANYSHFTHISLCVKHFYY